MRVHPFSAAAALVLVGVTALCSAAVVQHRRARARRASPPPELDEPIPAPRHIYFNATPPAPTPAPPPGPPPPPGGELHLHATGPHGLAVPGFDVIVHRRGDAPDDWTPIDSDEIPAANGQTPAPGTFATSDLEPGRYDVRVEAEGMRTIRLDDVPTGPKVIEVVLARRPALLGAVGQLGGAGCAGVTVTWSGPGDDAETGDATVDDDCTFFVEAIPEDGPLTVVAKRGALESRALVTPPLSGDPGFLCLAPPCAEEPASLLVYVADTEHAEVSDASLSWTLQADELHGGGGLSEGMGVLWMHGRRAGQTLALRAERDGHVAEASALLGAGVTEVLLTLPAEPPPTGSADGDLDTGGDDDDADEDDSTRDGHFVRDRIIIVH